MQSSAYLIDVSGRAGLFVYPALVEAIDGGILRGLRCSPGPLKGWGYRGQMRLFGGIPM